MILHACDPDTDPMTFICETNPYLLKVYLQTKNELSRSRLSKVIVLNTDTDTQTDRQTDRQKQPEAYSTLLGK